MWHTKGLEVATTDCVIVTNGLINFRKTFMLSSCLINHLKQKTTLGLFGCKK